MTQTAAESLSSSAAHAPSETADRAVARWLWSVAALVFLMVIVGGATRLTESGLSITEWKPVTGVLLPMGEAAWLAEFEKYKQIPQYREMNLGMSLADFRYIYLWEWGHRLLGRFIGIAFALPLAFFWLRGMVRPAMKPKLLGLLALGGLQGFVGWWMVKSGLVGRVEVAQERLAIHLLLASVTFIALVWLATRLTVKRPGDRVEPRTFVTARVLLALTLVQIGLGALVAGLRAGLTYNTWPLMDGRFIPPLENLTRNAPVWMNLLDNVTTVQFQHRMMAYVLVALALWHAVDATRDFAGAAARRARALAGLMLAQMGIGILTLLLVVPVWAGVLHQGFAMVVLAMATVHVALTRRA